MKIGKPKTIYVSVQDRANGVFRSLTVYGKGHREVVSGIRKTFAPRSHRKKRERR